MSGALELLRRLVTTKGVAPARLAEEWMAAGLPVGRHGQMRLPPGVAIHGGMPTPPKTFRDLFLTDDANLATNYALDRSDAGRLWPYLLDRKGMPIVRTTDDAVLFAKQRIPYAELGLDEAIAPTTYELEGALQAYFKDSLRKNKGLQYRSILDDYNGQVALPQNQFQVFDHAVLTPIQK